MAEIVLDEVTKRYPDGMLAVNKVSLDIADGEFVVLVGPSGCGKSTTLNMIAGLEDITSGELRIGGKVVNDKAPKNRDIAMVFHSYALYPHMTVRENMGFALKLAKTPKNVIDEKVNEAARILDLTPFLDRSPANLSGGQRQRVAMGRAIVRDPAAFLMDEPLSNLDAKLRAQMRTEVSRLLKRLGTTTVHVTHDQVEAMTLGDRVAVMRLGTIQQVASPQELYDEPANLFVASFIGSPAMNFVSGTLEEGKLRTYLGDFSLSDRQWRAVEREGTGREVIVGLRPENFEDASLVPSEYRPYGITLRTNIDVLESTGSDVYVYFTKDILGGGVISAELEELAKDSGRADTGSSGDIVVARLDAATAVREGQEAELWLDGRALHVFDPATGRNLSLAADDAAYVRGQVVSGQAAIARDGGVAVGGTLGPNSVTQTAAEGRAGEPAEVAARAAPRERRREEADGLNPRTREKGKDASLGDRFLVGRVREKAEVGREFFLSLQVKVTRPEPMAGVSQSHMRVDRGGHLLAVLVADPHFLMLSDDKVIVPVPQEGEGPEKGFTLRAQRAGTGLLRVDVYQGTQALDTFRFPVAVTVAHSESEAQAASVGIPETPAPSGLMRIVLTGPKERRNILLVAGENYLGDHPLEIGESALRKQLQRITAQLNAFTDSTARGSITRKRGELHGLGKQIYSRLLPGPFVEEFRAHRSSAHQPRHPGQQPAAVGAHGRLRRRQIPRRRTTGDPLAPWLRAARAHPAGKCDLRLHRRRQRPQGRD